MHLKSYWHIKRLCVYGVLMYFGGMCSAFSQEQSRCNQAFGLVFDAQENMRPSSINQDLFIDDQNNYVLFYDHMKTEKSFWYRIEFQKDATLEFALKPLNGKDVYNFCIYKSEEGSDFCADLSLKSINPVRTNLYRNLSSKGVGLKAADHTSKNNNWIYTYQTPYQEPVKAQKKDVYYMNVYRIQGDGCGFELQLSLNKTYVGLISSYKHCYPLKTHLIKSKNSTLFDPEILQLNTLKNFKNILVLKTQFKDSITGESITGTIVHQYNQNKVTEQIPLSGKKVLLEGKFSHAITCLATGYQSKQIFVDKQELKYIEQAFNIELSPVQKGDKFDLENIFFYARSYAFKPISSTALNDLVALLNKRSDLHIDIIGHTNGKGKVRASKNTSSTSEGFDFKGNEKKLSKYRAQAVKEYLVNKGIAANRLKVIGKGAEEMKYPRPENQFEKDQNKRVEIFISQAKL